MSEAVAVQEIERDGDALLDELRDHGDRDVADTALVFNNGGSERGRAICRGFDKNGQSVGGAAASIPAGGLRYLRASDLSDGLDFVGSATCTVSERERRTGGARSTPRGRAR